MQLRFLPQLVLLLLLGASVTTTQADILEDVAKPAVAYKAARISSFDRSGGNADALSGILPGETAVLAEIDGPGMISHIWITVNAEKYHGRKIVLRMFWDDEQDPSVLAPLNDFFCMGHGIEAPMWSIPITTTAEGRARNSYFKMPFNKKARIEITNEGLEPIGAFYYYIDYRKYEKPFEDPVYFHARYRQEYPARKGERYLICSATGRGHYVGTVFSIESHSEGWWGEGDDRFFIDGETTPSLHGTGSEDYLNDAWGIWKGSSPYYGSSIHEGKPYIYPNATRYTSFRFHLPDPIPFTKSLVFDIEHWGAGMVDGKMQGFVERFDNLSSVAYWYQTEPHQPMEALPPVRERLPDEAKVEKALYAFLEESRKPQTAASVEELCKTYEELQGHEEVAKYAPRLKARMASAEVSAGHVEAARRMLGKELKPFVYRSLAEELENPQTLLGESMTPRTALLVPSDDGSVMVVDQEGTAAVATDAAANGHYLYFAVPKDSPFRQKTQTIRAKVRYYSKGLEGDSFLIQYNSPEGEGTGDAYRASEVVKKSPQRGWHTAEVLLPGAKFASRQNSGADFRIAHNEDGDEVIAAIELTEAGAE